MSKLRETATQPAFEERRARTGRGPLRPHVLAAVCARDFIGYFSSPAGYVFLALFVVVCSWAQFWQPLFFANNLANLAPLNEWMPFILLFFIPAITMSTWAEERKQGTEELLLTLPARDVEVVLGKYFAALGIYTVAVVILAFVHIGFLRQLGSPDLGVLAANYLGYWLMGGMLVAFGMVASMLSNNATVAFILGGLFGAVPVFAKLAAAFAPAPSRRLVEGLSVADQFRDFGSGVVSLSGVLYFVSLAAGMLYLNMVLLGRRHWAGGEQSRGRGLHAAARVAAVIVALAGLDVFVGKTLGSWRLDLTEERLHTLTTASLKILRAIPKDRPVFIDAYISPEVPREYVQTRLDLINTLKEFAALGGDRIRLNLVSAERFSPAARDAEKRFGIAPREVRTVENARQDSAEITLGVAFTSGLEEVVVPFFDRGLPVEYEVARSVRVASGTARKRVGVLSTDAKLMPGMDFSAMGGMNSEGPWSVVTELKKQYDVTTVSADAPIPTNLDALIVAQPSSLTDRQLPNLKNYIRGGGPTLLLVDPLPGLVGNPDLAPREPKRPPGGMFAGGAQPEPKGDFTPLMRMLGVVWEDDQIVWNPYNPYKKYSFPREAVFVSRDATPGSFGDDPTTSGLQVLFLPYCGELAPLAGATTEFRPLLTTDETGGTVAYGDLFQSTPFGMQPLPPPQLVPTHRSYTIAARVTGPLAPEPISPPDPRRPPAAPPTPSTPGMANVIVVADLDLVADQIFRLRLKANEAYDDLDFDNVAFLLNCIDSLADEESFIPLRARKAKHRTLKAVEAQEKTYTAKADEEAKAADADAKKQLAAANASLTAQVEAIRANKEMDEREKQTALGYREAVEKRKLEVATAEIQDKKKARIKDAQATSEQSKLAIENGIRAMALLVSPLPALLLAGIVFAARKRNENVGATPARLA